jgi:hypothetical protein
VLVSMAHFRHTEYSLRVHPHAATRCPEEYIEQNADDLAWYWAKHVISYLAMLRELPVNVVFYERLKADLVGEAAALAHSLRLPLARTDVAGAVGSADFDTMRAKSPQHMRAGTAGKWRDELSDDQLRRVEEIVGPLLDLLGYRSGTNAGDALPALPDGAIGVHLRDALVHARDLSRRRCRPGWAM